VIDLTPQRIREVCRAALLAGGPGPISPADMPRRAVVDSREVGPGDLFVGIRGEHVDGGQFAERAIEVGAWGVLLRPEHGLRVAGTARRRVRVMAVDDPLEALGRLARAWVDQLATEGCKVVGITGSTGKTSTKDILRALLGPPLGDAVHASRANYNTEVGLPLAVLEADATTKVMVLEMAMRGAGQIRELCEIAPPAVGVITNVGPVHLELLGTVEAVAEAKAELIAALPPAGFCVVPAAAEALRPHLRREVRTLTFAEWPVSEGDALSGVERVAGAAADIRVLGAVPTVVDGTEGMRAQIAVRAEHAALEFNFRQAHNLVNALAAIGAAHALGLPLEELAEGARRIAFSELRGEQVELANGVVVINDCYNANPMSMRAALDHLQQVVSRRQATRSVAVLGEMAELGPAAAGFHRKVGEYAAARGVDLLVAVGGLADAYLEGFANAGERERAADAGQAAEAAATQVRPGDVVLVKGSRSVGLERVTETLVERVGAEREKVSGLDRQEGR
jgi:UDP-N-acetylmuramoyl-tripeptide--D-alanyl-D-alanine ligase